MHVCMYVCVYTHTHIYIHMRQWVASFQLSRTCHSRTVVHRCV